jgi:hypothetical protein
MLELHLDEAGYTGPDLLNQEQPVYALAAVRLPADVSRDLVAKCFAGVQARELKHSALHRRPHGRQQILDLINALADCPDSASVTVSHKECVLLGMLVDYWVEPALRRDGINLYERGANIGLVNVTYMTLGALLHEGRREFLRRFQVMVRDRTIFAYESFWRMVKELCREHPRFAEDLFGIYLAADLRLGGVRHLWELPEYMLDQGDYGLLQTISHWREKSNESLLLVHDHNTALARNQERWQSWLRGDVPPALVGQDRRVTRFPLDATLQLAESSTHIQLQLADIVAGATVTLLQQNAGRTPKHPDYVQALRDGPLLDRCLIGGVWPSDKVAPEDLDTEGPVHDDAAEYMAALVSRSKKSSS